MQGRNGDAGVENGLVDAAGEGEHARWRAGEKLLDTVGAQSGACDDLQRVGRGRGLRRKGQVYNYGWFPLCMAETNTTRPKFLNKKNKSVNTFLAYEAQKNKRWSGLELTPAQDHSFPGWLCRNLTGTSRDPRIFQVQFI